MSRVIPLLPLWALRDLLQGDLYLLLLREEARDGAVVEALRYYLDGRGFDFQ
jgi:hypothetical protein